MDHFLIRFRGGGHFSDSVLGGGRFSDSSLGGVDVFLIADPPDARASKVPLMTVLMHLGTIHIPSAGGYQTRFWACKIPMTPLKRD